MTLLENINSPADLRRLKPEELQEVADEIRQYILETMSRVGGHTGASFGAGHASTSLSAALGMAIARDRKGENHNVVALIGDASLAGGMAMEAVNQAGHLKTRLIVLLNDNEMSIAPAVGALTGYLNRIR